MILLPAARQHFNSNVEAVDDGDIVVIWAEWDKSKLDGGSHAVEPLIGRTEVLVVAEGRWDQSAILSMVRVELDLPAPLGKDPVACGQWSCAATASGSRDYCSSRNTPPFYDSSLSALPRQLSFAAAVAAATCNSNCFCEHDDYNTAAATRSWDIYIKP